MNAKGETLRPSPAWEALPSGSSLGSNCMETLGADPRTARPLLLADELSRAGVLRCKPVHLGVCERTRAPPQEPLRIGPGATDNAGKVFPARGVMVPLF